MSRPSWRVASGSDYQGFGELLRKRRKEARLTIGKVAGQVGLSLPYLGELERGVRQPPLDDEILGKLAVALSVDQDTLRLEAELCRRYVTLTLEGYGKLQRELAVMLEGLFSGGLGPVLAHDIMVFVERQVAARERMDREVG